LDLLGIRFTGNTAATLTVALDKRVAKGLLALAGVATPHGQVFRTVPRPEVARDVRYPVVVKPLREDASLGVTPASFVRDEEELRAQVARVVAEHGQPALAESYLPGREFNAAVLGEGKAARVLPLAEISFQGYAPGEARLVTHDAKWCSGSRDCTRTVPVCPADLDPSLRTRIEEAALASHRVFECRDYARVDIRLDGRGRPHVLEVNPNPDISRAAGLARAVLASGMSYEDFVEGVALQAWRRG
jgi:D-alanine-D-alanine ligase